MTSIHETSAAEWGQYERLVRRWMHHLPVGELHDVVAELRGPAWDSLPEHLQGQRQILRADVAEHTAERQGWPAWPFPGDLLPGAPDDGSGLPSTRGL